MGGDGQQWPPAFVSLNEIHKWELFLEMTSAQDEKALQFTDNN